VRNIGLLGGFDMDWPMMELKMPWPLVNVEDDNGELVVRFHSEGFLWPSVDEVGKVLMELARDTDDCQFILDFGNVDYLTAIGLEKLVHLNRELKNTGRRLIIKNVSKPLVKLLSLTGLTSEFDVNPVEEYRVTC
jgi:anti-anti-sigma factor